MKLFAYLTATGIAALVFSAAPELDIAFSGLFYREGEGFFASHWPPFDLLYDLVPWVRGAVIALVIGLVLARALAAFQRAHVRTSAIAYITLSLAIGPGLITNVVLKDNMGRARPSQTIEFGGTRTFTPALVRADQCPKNCSFVSGHAAMGFFLVTFAFLMAPGYRRRAVFAATITLATAIGLARIGQGDHFLSDVVFAGLINIAVAWALYAWLAARDGPGGRFLGRWDERLAAKAEPGAVIASHPHALAAVALLSVLSYLFLDRPAIDWFLTFGRDFHLLVKGIAKLGEAVYWLVPSALAFTILWLAAGHQRFAGMGDRLKAWSMLPLFVFLSLSFTGMVVKIMKISFGRMRPLHHYRYDDYGFSWFEFDASLQSFPSGHAVTAVTLMAALYFIMPRFQAAFVALGTVVVLARALETVHYLSDVLVGATMAIWMTAWMQQVFLRSGVDLPLAARGRLMAGPRLPWGERLGLPPWAARAFAVLR
ncbi:MAG: phosphatase PAP2 family protein [Alphaproteobacteria bacterium]|nr:phosphatase PAP2 family protein [Alphaproteobacteria bacterium]